MPSAIVFRLLLALALPLGLGACSEPPRDSLRFAISSVPDSLDPRFAVDAASERINRLLYQRLVDFDQALRPVPALAEWERLAPRHYRFRLRGGARFHDGSPLTAADVRATLEFILDPANASPHRSALEGIERIAPVDERTLDFYLRRADPLFPGHLSLGIVPRKAIASGHPLNRHPIGSGPFVFVDWPEEGRLRLRRRSDGRIVEFVHVADPTVRVLKLLSGEVDMLQNDLPPEMVAYLEGRDEVVVQRGRGTNFTYLGFNLEDPVTGLHAVRQAIAHAVDRRAIIEYVLGGAARPAQALLPPGHWAGNAGLTGYAHDPQRARALLREAGFGPDNPARITYKTSSDPFRIRLATIIRQQLAEVGIQVDLRSYDWGTFFGDVKAGRFQMYSLSWVGIKTPDIFRYVFHSESIPPAGANRGRFRDQRTDALIEQAEQAADTAAQAAAYARLQAHLLRELPYVPLWYEDHVFVARKGIEGYTIALDGNYDGLIDVHAAH